MTTNESAGYNGNPTDPDVSTDGGRDKNNWETVGRSLLRLGLEDSMTEVEMAFTKVSRKVGQGEAVTEQDVQRMYNALDEAESFVDEAAIAAGTNPRQSLRDVMSSEEIAEYAERCQEGDR